MRQFLGQITDGESVDEIYLAADKQLRSNRNGQPYIQIELRDRSGGITGRMWNAGEQVFRTFEAGDFVRVQGKVQTFQGSLQMIVTGIKPAPTEGVEPSDFLPHADADIGKLLDRLRTILRSLKNPFLKALGEVYLTDEQFIADFAACPAGVKQHHSYVGGLLEHVVTLLEAGDRLAPLYPIVDRDLWLLGLFLHDAGKLRELSFKGGFAYTDAGQLVGHLVQGVEMLNEMVLRVELLLNEKFPEELKLRLQHVIVSHHGSYEHGSPKLPMTPEAVAVHALDNLDAKLNQVARELNTDRGGGSWTSYNPSLQRRFFKGGPGSGTVEGE
ncbi:MAG: HD domain-containing protein [Gemmataceae bacterium]|nr:HD domain-containing protein [Gemmataceae bacterium]